MLENLDLMLKKYESTSGSNFNTKSMCFQSSVPGGMALAEPAGRDVQLHANVNSYKPQSLSTNPFINFIISVVSTVSYVLSIWGYNRGGPAA